MTRPGRRPGAESPGGAGTAPRRRPGAESPGGERPWRLFVALEPPDDVRAALAAYGAAADDAVWRAVAADSLHVTLAFLGSRPPSDAGAIAPLLQAEAGSPAPRLRIAGALLLPPRRARVLTVALDDAGDTLHALQRRVAAALTGLGVYAPDTRPFRAHITVARLRAHAASPRDALPAPQAEFTAKRLTLYRSLLHPTGARYEPLTGAMLAD